MRRTIWTVLLCSGCFFDSMSNAVPPDDSTSSDSGSTTSDASDDESTSSSSTPTTSDASSDESGESTDGSSSGSEVESTSEQASSTGEAPPQTYAPCTQDDQSACGDDETCIWTDGVQEGTKPSGFCSKPCDTIRDCPDTPDGSDAEVACTYYYADLPLWCMLRCPDGRTCPEGMSCYETMYLPEVAGMYSFVCA